MNIRISDCKTQAVCFSYRRRTVEVHLTLNTQNMPFESDVRVKYLGVIFDKRITCRMHAETISAKAFRIFIRPCILYKSRRLSARIELNLHKALVRSILT